MVFPRVTGLKGTEMNVIVTGASRGIGRGIATVLAMDGFKVGLLARSGDLLEDLRESIEAQGGESVAAACDLSDYDATVAAIDSLSEQLGGLDALINNAGTVTRKSILEITVDEWRAMVDSNIHGMFHATKAALPHLQARGAGRIINLSSISGKYPLPGGSGYAATKYAVTGFSQSIFHELRDQNIHVSTIYPGSVDSQSERHGDDSDTSWKVSPEEVGQSCAFILKSHTGTVIHELEIRPLKKGS